MGDLNTFNNFTSQNNEKKNNNENVVVVEGKPIFNTATSTIPYTIVAVDDNLATQKENSIKQPTTLGKKLYSNVFLSFNQIYGENSFLELFPQKKEEKNKAILSFTSFLIKTGENTVKEILGDTKLKTQFFSKIIKTVKEIGFDFEYSYCFLRNVSEKDENGNKTGGKQKVLSFGIQYQDELKILSSKNINFTPFYIFNEDDFKVAVITNVVNNEIKIIKKPIIKDTAYITELDSLAPDDLQSDIKTDPTNNSNTLKQSIDDFYKKIKFIAVLIEKDGKLMDVEIINKSSIHSSLKATYYKYNGSLSNSIKTKAGLKNILDIMVCHKIYKKYCEFSYDTDDLEYDFDNNNDEKEKPNIKPANQSWENIVDNELCECDSKGNPVKNPQLVGNFGDICEQKPATEEGISLWSTEEEKQFWTKKIKQLNEEMRKEKEDKKIQ